MSAASAGGGDAARGEVNDGEAAEGLGLLDELEGRADLLGVDEDLILVHRREPADVAHHGAAVANRLDDVPGASLAFGANHGGTLGDAPESLAEVAAAAEHGNLEVVLVDVVNLVRGGEHLGLVDVVDPHGFQHLRLDEVPDARLGHDGDGDGILDRLDHGGVGHAGDAAVLADVGGDALERHDGDGASLLGDARLLDVDDVHDDATLEHLID
jgi:hypothetical protein